MIPRARSWPRRLAVLGAVLIGVVHGGPGGAQTPPLDGRVVTEDDILGMPTEMTMFAGRILVRDRVGDPTFHLIDPLQGIVSSFGRRGDGPGEYEGPQGMNRAVSTNDVWIVDVAKRRFTRLTTADARPEVAETFALTGLALAPTAVLPVGDTAFLVMGESFAGGHDNRFALIDREGRLLAAVGPPYQGDADIPFTDRSAADAAKARLNPSGTRIAAAYLYRSEVKIYGLDGSRITTADTPPEDRFVTEFLEPSPPTRMRWFYPGDRTTRYGYRDVATTDDFIFALYSGISIWDGSHSNRVHVFSWSGRFISEFTLDRSVIAITVDERGETLYATGFYPLTPGVYAYALPPSFRTRP